MQLREHLESLQRLLIPQGDLAERAVKSGIWVTLINVFDRILQLGKLVVLARFLAPSDFGLMGIALLTLATLEQFSQLGIDAALIQRKEEQVDEFLNTAWTMKIVRGIGITAFAFVVAPFAAQFFGEPRATDIIRVIAVVPLIRGLQNPGVMYLKKNLEFHKQFIYTLSSTASNVIVAVGAAVVFQNVWALVFGTLAGGVMTFAVSYVIHEYRPQFEFNKGLAEELFGFGKWITASGILVFLYSQGDDAFIGWFLGATALGFYQMAYRFSNAPATEVTHVISRVAFPTLSKVQNDTEKLREGFRRAVQLSTTVAFPMAAGIAAVAPQFVPVVLGDQWRPAIPVIQVLAVWGGIRAFGANVGPLYKSTGRPDIEARIQTLKVISIIIIIYPAAEWFGLAGVASAIVISSSMSLPVHLYYVLSITQAEAVGLLKLIAYPLVSSIGMASSVVMLDTYVLVGTNILNLVFLIIFGSIFYFLVMIVFEYIFGVEFTQLYQLIKQKV